MPAESFYSAYHHGFARVAACTAPTAIADPARNADSIVAVASPQTLGLLAFLSAGLVNFFVPSGGGQVAIQAPILLDAAARLGVDPAVVIMAVSYGDQWTNMIQPFWALPLLAIAGLRIRDILGYTTVVLLVSGLVFGATMLVVGAGV